MAFVVNVDTKGGDERDVVGWVERVDSLRDELAAAAFEAFVTEEAKTMLPTGSGWATQEEQRGPRSGEEAVPPPSFVA